MLKKILVLIVILLLCLGNILIFNFKNVNKPSIEQSKKQDIQNPYLECLKEPYLSEKTNQKIIDFLNKHEQDSFAVYFEDINNQYNIVKNENQKFYGASLIKLLDATYLIKKALSGEIDLREEKITYKQRHKKSFSLNMQNYQIGSLIDLETLISYAIKTSDNTAHEMLYEYIGYQNLIEYGKTLNIDLTISQTNHYSDLSVTETNTMLKDIYEIISSNTAYSSFLVENMENTYYNSLNFNENKLLHKYGSTDPYFHDIGIYNDEQYPYLISIMTTIGEQPSPNKITEIHQEIRKIYEENLKEKEKYCQQFKE